MSFRQALRSRFKSDKHDKGEDGGSPPMRHGSGKRPRTLSDNRDAEETFEVLNSDREDDGQSFMSTSSHSPVGSESSDMTQSFKDAEEKVVFEQQLTQLQEQLVAVMIENQALQTELREHQDKSPLIKMGQELEYHKHRSKVLEEKCASLERKRSHVVHRRKSDADRHRHRSGDSESVLDVSEEEVVGDAKESHMKDAVKDEPTRRRWHERFMDGLVKIFYDVMEDFSDLPEDHSNEDPEGDPLTVKKLKDNIKRFGTEAKPYLLTARGVYNLLTWKSPPYTLIVFIVYMYSVYTGWFLPVMCACFTFRLFVNYLQYRGWNVNFNFFDPGEDDKEQDESKDLGVSDKFNLVLQVARKAQNFLGSFADNLEKMKSLLTWRHPSASKQLFFGILCATITSCLFPPTYLFYVIGLMMGVKMFLIDYLYVRFPRLKLKYDTTHQMWLQLPTDAEYEKRNMKSELNRYILPANHSDGEPERTEPADVISTDDKTFCELFNLPLSESPLPGWQGGRRCTLINREKSITAAFKNGKLFLTRSFLCFERTKTPSPKNIVIPLADITRMEKAKPYAWLPGGGMSIEIVIGDKPLLIGGMLNRDEVFDSIHDHGVVNQLPWVTGKQVKQRHLPLTRRQSQFLNFSIGTSGDSD